MKQPEEKENRRRLVLLIAVLVTIVTAGVMLPEPESKHHGHDSDGTAKSLSSIIFAPYITDTLPLKDKPYVLLEFFTTNCKFCKASVDELNALNRHEKLNVIAYTYEGGKKVRGFIEAYGAEYPISRATQQFRDQFGHSGVPASYLVDTKTLEVKASFIGKVNRDEVLSLVK